LRSISVRRVLKWTALAVVVVAIVAGIVFRSTVAAQARALVVLTTTLDPPVLAWTVRVVTGEPDVDEIVLAEVPTTFARPDGSGPWPAVVFVNGATRRGRHHPHVRRLARGLARAGYVAAVPDLPGLRQGEITVRTATRTIAVTRAVSAHPDVRDGRVALFGVSVGATLALLAAEDPRLAPRVSVVAGIAPYTNLVEVIRIATTGFHRSDGRLLPYRAESFLSLVTARSLAAALPPGRDRSELLGRLRVVDDDARAPLGVLGGRWTTKLGRRARSVVVLLRNRDPRRLDRLYARLPLAFRARMRRLSPILTASRMQAPIEIASAPHDKYFPLSESRVLAREADVRITVTSTLEHAIPEASLSGVADIFRFHAFIVRALRRARD
jgi:alpha-beta hydrolase superfamily lysophospholipase